MITERKIVHIDMDAFYASVEIRDNPQWKGKPLVVGGEPHSRAVVCAASYEARKYGIRSAMSCYKAFQLCPEAIFVPPRFEAYKEVSFQIRNIFFEYTDLVEPLSLDEAYLDVTQNKKNQPLASEIAKEIKKKVLETTGLTCSAGVSYNKFLAKMASEHRKPNGLYVIPPDKASNFLETLALEKFYGIGKKTAERLRSLGLQTGKDLKEKSKAELTQIFGKMGQTFYEIVRGMDDRAVEPFREAKSIGAESTFERDSDQFSYLQSELHSLALEVARRLQKKKKKAKTITLKVKNAEFLTKTRSFTRKDFFDAPEILFEMASSLFLTYWNESPLHQTKIRLLGIQCSHFLEEGHHLLDNQPSLFSMEGNVSLG